MASVQITFTRTCEYVATVDTAELRELVSRLPGNADALAALDRMEAGEPWAYDDRAIAYILNNTETGREWLGGMADNPDMIAATGAPEVTELKTAG